MTALTIARPSAGLSYAKNVGHAARALLSALLAVTPERREAAATAEAAQPIRRKDDISLYRLYCLAGSYDSVMPNLAQEIRAIAGRD